MTLRPSRTHLAPLMVALMILVAGCAGFGNTGGGETTTEAMTTTAEPTESPAETTTDGEATENRTAAMSGALLLSIDGEDTHLDEASSSGSTVWINESQNHTWHAATDSVTLSEALQSVGVEAAADSLTYDGTTYETDEADTTVAYRVDGEVVENPSEYELDSDDTVSVHANAGDVDTPGQYISDDHPHPHGELDVTVDGEAVNFTNEEYVQADRYFHFHGDEAGEHWHGHSTSITLEYAISTFPGMALSGDSVTVENTTYDLDDESVTVTVNGESVDPETYVVKDGDHLEITVSE